MSSHTRLPPSPARPPPAAALALAKPALRTSERDAQTTLAGVAPPLAPTVLPAPPLAAHERRDIRDDDAARAQLTRWLVHDLAPMLGLDPTTVRISSDAEAAVRTEAEGAAGLSTAERILLHPRRFRPETVAGRALLAHELVHNAQRALPSPSVPLAAPLARAAAEDEARRLGTAFAAGHTVYRPQIALPAAAQAADAPPPSLASSVRDSRSREIALIHKFLSGWWISDGDVSNILEILDNLAWPVAEAVLMALDSDKRYALADNINEPHVLAHRRSVLIAYQVLEAHQGGAIDLDVVRALPTSGMSTEEKGAAANLMHKLGNERRAKLLKEDRGPRLHSLIMAPLPIAGETERIAKEKAKAVEDEAALALKRRRIVQLKGDTTVKRLVEQVREQLAPRTDAQGTHAPNGADALAAVDLLARVSGDTTRLASIGEQMEDEGLTDLLLQLLPPGHFTDTSAHIVTIGGIVQARLPWKNARLVEDLLSTGLFDWSISADEALFAYNIIKSLPLAEQLRFRRRDAGKWYVRLIEALPRDREGLRLPGLEIRKAESEKDLAKLEAEGIQVDHESMLYNVSQVYERKLKEQGAVDALNTLLNRFAELRKGIYRDHEGRELYLRLVDLGKGSIAACAERPADQLLREAVVRELDNHGYIDELFSELPESFLFAEEHRSSTVKIMLARDPARVQNHARELVSRGFTDWMVKDHEAYLAFLCIKALPQAESEAFKEQYPELWSRVLGEMSEEQRQASDTNVYVGEKSGAGVDRASVLAQLADAGLWTTGQLQTLNGLLHMALAMSEHRFAFARSEQFKAHSIPGLEALVEKYKLYNPAAGRKHYAPHDLEGTAWHDEGPFATLKTIGNGLVALWNTDIIAVDNKIGAKVDLNSIQDVMGGDLGGARLAKVPKDAKKARPDVNTLSFLVGDDGKSAELTLPELLIERANVQFGSSTFQTGAVAFKDLRLKASYDAEDLGQPTQAHVLLGSVVANDMLLVFGDSMIAIARMALQALRIATGAIDTVTGSQASKGKTRSIPFPLLAIPLLAWLMVYSVPIYLYMKIAGMVDKSPGPAERFPGELAQRTKALDFSFSSLDAHGVTTSGGQRIAHVGIQQLAVRVGLNKATRLRAERASLDQRLARLQGRPEAGQQSTELQARRAQVDKQLAAATLQEQQYLAIQAKIRAGGLSADEQRALQQDLNKLKFEEDAGAYIDIGEISAEGLSGTITAAKPIVLSGIHGEGGGRALTDMLAMPTATDLELSRRSAAGERPAAPTKAGLTIEIGDVGTGKLEFGGGLRTVESIDAELRKLVKVMDTPEIRPLFDSLLALRGKAVRHELLVQHGVSNLNQAELKEFLELRRVLAAEASLVLDSLAIAKMKLEVDLVNGGIEVSAGAAHIKGLKMPAQGIEIDEVIGRGLGVGALPNGGLLGWKDWKKNLRDAGGKVDHLELKGVRSRMHGLLFEKATLTGAYAGMAARGDSAAAGLKRLQITGAGIAPRVGVLQRRLAVLKEKLKQASGKEKTALSGEIATLESTVTRLQQLADTRIHAYASLQSASTPAEVEAAKKAVAEADATIIMDLAQYGAGAIDVEEFGIRANGLGDVLTDVLEDRFSLDSVLDRGATISGAGPNGMLVRKVTVSDGRVFDDKPGSGKAAEAKVELGETRLTLHAQRVGDDVIVDLKQFEIDAFSLSELLLTADEQGKGMQIGSTGLTTLEGMHVNGKLILSKRADVKGKGSFPDDFRLASIVIDDFAIAKVSAGGLTYRSIPDKIEATLQSGSINHIWAKNTTLTFPEQGDMTIVGGGGIDSITDLQVRGALKNGMALTGGRIDSKAIGIDFLSTGAVRASVTDLSATAMSLRGPDGWARFSLNHLSGAVFAHNGVITLENVKLGSIDVPAVHWKAGTRTIDADKPARLADIRVKGSIKTSKVDDTEAGAGARKTKLDAVIIDELTIGLVTAEHLVYRDGDDEVEIGASKEDSTAAMAKFRPLAISDIRVEHLEWDPDKGVDLKKLDIGAGAFEASVVYRDLKANMQAGIALKGKKVGASFIGKDFIVGNTGTIDKTTGFFKGKGVDTSFSTGKIVGSYTLTDKGVTLNGLEVDKIAIGRTTYTAPTMSVTLGGARAEHLSIGKIDVGFEETVAEDGKKGKKLKSITVGEIVLTGLTADTFDYKGSSYEVNAQGNTVASKVDLHARRAWIDRFTVHGVVHDMAQRLTTVQDFAVDSRSGKPAFGVQGVVAKLSSAVMGKHTSKVFLTDIEGGKLTGDDISFQTIKTGEKTVDGKVQEITRSAIGGRFKLTSLALIHPMAVLTDEDGKTTYIGGIKNGNSRLVLTGIEPVIDQSGNIIVPIKSITARNFLIKTADASIELPWLQLSDFAVALKGQGSEEGIELLAARLKSFVVQGLRVDMDIDRGKKSKDAKGGGFGAGKYWYFEPLGGMDADVTGEYDKLDPALTVGVYWRVREGKSGLIPVRDVAEWFINKSTSPDDDKKDEEPTDLSFLKDITAQGSVSVGNGRVGLDSPSAGYPTDNGTYVAVERRHHDDNRFKLSRSRLGEQIKLSAPRFTASGARIAAFGPLPAGKIGPLTFTGIKVRVTGLANLQFHVTVTVKEGLIENIDFGDLTFLKQDSGGVYTGVKPNKVKSPDEVNP